MPNRDESLRIRLSTQEKERLRLAAVKSGLGVSEFVRDWIKSLPAMREGRKAK